MSTSWVLSIDETHPQHWDYAIGTGFWDLRTSRKIQAGDLVYFWQTKGSFVGRVRATSDVYPIDASTAQPGPWDDWPGTYEARFDFALLDAHAARLLPPAPRLNVVGALSLHERADPASERPGA